MYKTLLHFICPNEFNGHKYLKKGKKNQKQNKKKIYRMGGNIHKWYNLQGISLQKFINSSCCSRRRRWHPTSVLLPGKSHGQRSPVGCSPWGCSVGQDWATSLSLFTFMHWRRKWQPTPVFLPGESQGWQSLVGCRLWGRTELDTTEAT